MSERTCLDCVHCEHWTEYGSELHDCRLATKESRDLYVGKVTPEEYSTRWSVYLFAIDQCCEDAAATHCPQYEALEVHEHG
jgi:hypothetical protein